MTEMQVLKQLNFPNAEIEMQGKLDNMYIEKPISAKSYLEPLRSKLTTLNILAHDRD